jgi:hypothetical protein
VVEGLLSLKKGPDAALLELENDARDALLEKVSRNCCRVMQPEVVNCV